MARANSGDGGSTTTGKKTATSTGRKTTRRRTSAAPQRLKVLNPTTGQVYDEIPAVSPAEVADAVAQARKVAPEWAAIPPQGRARILREVRYRLYDRIDAIVETMMKQSGKPRLEALAHEIAPTALTLLALERTAPRYLRPDYPGGIFGRALGSRIEWRPHGVVGAITPWNYPIFNCFLAFAPALFAGNTVVIKPSEVVPAAGEIVRDLLEPLPPGVATVVQGGGEVGAALVDAPVDKISFIGSPDTGRKIAAGAAKHLTPIVMELGGKDAAVVCEDADLDFTAAGILWGKFLNAGQTCCAVERVYVAERVADEFESLFVDKAKSLRQEVEGDLGSLTFPPQLDIVRRHVSDAVEKGARLLFGGPDHGRKATDGSLWFAPTVLTDVADEMDLMQEETFGPVVPLIRVRDDEEALRRANEEGPNLTASVWTSDRNRAERLAARLRAGTVTLNSHGDSLGVPWNPWGGVGESGFGRLNGKQGLFEFVVPVPIQRNPQPKTKKIWWYPYDEPSFEVLRGASELLTARTMSQRLAGIKKIVTNARASLRNKI